MINNLPDVVNQEKPDVYGKLDWVGMDDVELPVNLKLDDKTLKQSPARANIYVSLDNESKKGIHMSRLFIAAMENLASKELDLPLIEQILDRFLDSHSDISNSAKMELSFDFLTTRKSLKSENFGWRSYPVKIKAEKHRDEKMNISLNLDVYYSSTCPCSTALSRELNYDSFLSKFSSKETISVEEAANFIRSKEGLSATPHAQRSTASCSLSLDPALPNFDLDRWISTIEASLGTPVQAVVKREDEQEFARLNAANLMFSEDAGRRVKQALDAEEGLLDFRGKISHFESLHPHDAVAFFSK
ncbi:MAG: GTP cyclohydrolase FolE2 [Bdellovibrionales bacterium]